MREDAFGAFHPAITFTYFIAVIVFGMCFRHPAFYLAAVVFSLAYCLVLSRGTGISSLAYLVPLYVAITALNPLFVPYGDTVLFTYFGGRPFTLEALLYGAATGAMLVSMIMWFHCYNLVMTSDKFLCLFGQALPSLSLVFTMVLRFVPTYQRKAKELIAARVSLGRVSEGSTRRQKAIDMLPALGSLVSWAFENGLTTADSMRSRGHGLPGRTSFSVYRFCVRDAVLLAAMALLAVLAAVGGFSESARVDFIPTLIVPALGPWGSVGLACYCVLLAIPSVLNLKELLVWRISTSRI